MSFREWSTFVEVLSEEKELDIHDVREALVLCGPPVVPAIQVNNLTTNEPSYVVPKPALINFENCAYCYVANHAELGFLCSTILEHFRAL